MKRLDIYYTLNIYRIILFNYRVACDNSNTQSNGKTDKSFVPPIFNFVSSSSNPMTWGEFSQSNKKYGHQYPSTKSVSDGH